MRSVLAAFAALLICAAAPAAPEAHAHHPVRANAAAQAEFDRGLAFLWAFSIGEARLRFATAIERDPACAMCWWGLAMAETTDINSMQTPDGDERGAAAIASARAHDAAASAAERELIEALALRFAPGRTSDQRTHDWADAMRRYSGEHPDDGLGHTVAAYAIWSSLDDLVDAPRHPVPAALRIATELDAAVAADPDDLGAHHLRIHYWEDVGSPARALEDARFFDALAYAPGMSHLPHMAGHIYARLGMWSETLAANERALANDAAYRARGDGAGWRYLARYHEHDEEFAAYGGTSEGRGAAEIAGAGEFAGDVRAEIALRSGDPSAVLGIVRSDGDGRDAALRAIALARAGRVRDARALVARSVRAPGPYAPLAQAALARAAGDRAAELVALEKARRAVGGLFGDPKIAWCDPPGEAYGTALLRAGRAADAETVFREEIERFPNDPRLLFGLAEALRAQGKDDAEPRAAAARRWRGPHPLSLAELA